MMKSVSLLLALLAIAGINSRGAGWEQTRRYAIERDSDVARTARAGPSSEAQTRTQGDSPGQVTADQITRKNLEAMGNGRVHAIQSWKATGTIVTPPISEGGGSAPKADLQPMPLTVVVKQPNLSRVEMGSPPGTMVTVLTGERTWTNAPGSDSLQEMKETEGLEGLMRGLLRLLPETLRPVADYRGDGGKAELAGKEKSGEREAYNLRVRRKNGEESHVFIDARTFTKIKQSEIFGALDVDVHFDDYRSVEGVPFPRLLEFKGYGGQTFAKLTLEKIELNPRLDDAIFTTPARTDRR